MYLENYLNILDGTLDLQSGQFGGKKKKSKKLKNKLSRHIGSQNESNMSKSPDYVEHLSEPWFSLIALGLKTVEGRKNKGKFKDMYPGQIIQWFNDDFEPRVISTRIVSKQEYPTFSSYLEAEGLDNCLPGMPSLSHGLSVYYKYFTKEDEATYGVIALRLELIK